MQLKIKKLIPEAQLPTQTHKGDALDLYGVENIRLIPFRPTLVSLGIAVEIPKGYRLVFKERSGLALKGIYVKGGLIDNQYTGTLKAILCYIGDLWYDIKVGDKIVQAKLERVYEDDLEIIEVNELSDTERGSKGFGSSGK